LIFGNGNILLIIIVAILIIGTLSGIYPAFVLSNFKTTQILKGKFQGSKNGVALRKVLVVAQFVASIAMIIGSIFIYTQLEFIKNKQLGFNKDQVVTFAMNNGGLAEHAVSFKNEVMAIEGVSDAGGSTNMPGRTFGRTGVRPEGTAEEDDPWIVSQFSFDDKYLEVMGMEVTAGRAFTKENVTDQQEAVMVNEAMIAEMGWDEPIGKKLIFGNGENRVERSIIGVVKDFHFASMRHSIEPLIMFYNPETTNNISLKLVGDIGNSMDNIEETWKQLFPDHPFDYQFFDQEFDQVYRSDENFSRLIANFTWLAIFIACLGLFGLSAHIAEQRRKEVGIRKVLGSSIQQVVLLLSKEFISLIVIANIVAWPLAYYGVSRWLTDFQYKIDLWSLSNLSVYLISAVVALIIGLLTVSYKSISAALVNPVQSLRDE
jgi:putative ABC transport system permease protein